MIHVILVNGRNAVGKDTFISCCRDICTSLGYGKMVYSTIDPMKRALKSIGWDGQKTDDVRQLLADMKRLSMKNNTPMKNLTRYIIDKIQHEDDLEDDELNHQFIFIQMRESSEIDKLISLCDGLCYAGVTYDGIFITGNNRDNTKGADTDNVSKINTQYTYEVHNNGTIDDLEKYARVIIKEVAQHG